MQVFGILLHVIWFPHTEDIKLQYIYFYYYQFIATYYNKNESKIQKGSQVSRIKIDTPECIAFDPGLYF